MEGSLWRALRETGFSPMSSPASLTQVQSGSRLSPRLRDFVLPWALPPITWRPPLACQIQQCPHQSKFGFLWATPVVLREVGIGVCVWVKNLAHPIWPNPTIGSIPIQKTATAAGCQYTNFIRSRSSWQFCKEDWGLKTTSSSHKDREANLLSKKGPFWQFSFRLVIFLFSTHLLLDTPLMIF